MAKRTASHPSTRTPGEPRGATRTDRIMDVAWLTVAYFAAAAFAVHLAVRALDWIF